MLNQRSDKVELLRMAEAVASEKSIDTEIIISSMESAIQKAAKTKFGSENDIRAKIDRESGDISLHKVMTVVESPENLDTEISLAHAKKIENKENSKIGYHQAYRSRRAEPAAKEKAPRCLVRGLIRI